MGVHYIYFIQNILKYRFFNYKFLSSTTDDNCSCSFVSISNTATIVAYLILQLVINKSKNVNNVTKKWKQTDRQLFLKVNCNNQLITALWYQHMCSNIEFSDNREFILKYSYNLKLKLIFFVTNCDFIELLNYNVQKVYRWWHVSSRFYFLLGVEQ